CNATTQWKPTVKVDHAQIPVKICSTCHNGVVAKGKNVGHMNTQNACEACHVTSSWKLIVGVDHTQVLGTCVSCHSGLPGAAAKRGKNATHILTTNACEQCHSTRAWVPKVAVNHLEVLGTCESCHNNVIARGKSPQHITVLASALCSACHSTSTWLTTTVDHRQVAGTCGSCHNGISAKGKTPTHIPTTNECANCHATTRWTPALRVDHNQVLNLTSCYFCHDGTGRYAKKGKSATHKTTTNNCAPCHISTTSWFSVTFDHREAVGTCESCHAARIPQSHLALNVTRNCGTCHSTATWTNPTQSLPVTPLSVTAPGVTIQSAPVTPKSTQRAPVSGGGSGRRVPGL
ncbi:MAG: hypothetical protein OEW08_11850, partial [Gammaproteobacteria bacterium]|nr:hypothetical protein [Gammaproteobacteria bacterium]